MESPKKSPVACLVVGMAGAGKSTFLRKVYEHAKEEKHRAYMVNLDPAVTEVGFPSNIDIRDTVNYKEVMKQYSLGPNGGILTALNLFSTRFDQVMGILERRQQEVDTIFFDTPGQIEIFTWSASGAIITESLASSFPTVVLYIVDTPRTVSPATFMSNMLYACSIMYKLKVPFLMVFNKTDVLSHQTPLQWMADSDAFAEALQSDESYTGTLVRSMSVLLEEFYQNIRCVGVSSLTGEGFDELHLKIQEAAQEYLEEYKPELERRAQEKAREEEERVSKQTELLLKDLQLEEKK